MVGQKVFRSRKARQDDSVMGTNDSSIVSKRSVERIYYSEPHFYRYFVKKSQRRSPLINRGYWLRMYAVEYVMKRFIDEPSEKKKVVLNLGSGYDPVPFQWLSKDPVRCQNVTFIDIDYPNLLAKKSDIVLKTPQLRELLGPWERPSEATGVILRSKNYLAIGCDLADISKLNEVLRRELDISECTLLCIGEVSITYMDVRAADALIEWAAGCPNMHFCLLEQFLPGGVEHPFAEKMIQHFESLQTPLRSVRQYPHLADQEKRFVQAGWSSAKAKSLWDLWGEEGFISSERRLGLDQVEPFDEWEEFVLFASHYFLLVATNTSLESILSPFLEFSPGGVPYASIEQRINNPSMARRISVANPHRRRFGAVAQVSPTAIGHHGGLGTQSRLGTMDIHLTLDSYTANSRDVWRPELLPSSDMEPRMCHTITNLDHASLLVGGRRSPDHPLQDCWLYLEEQWKKVEDIPVPLFRHCATRVKIEKGYTQAGVLIYGGRTGSTHVSGSWFLWRESFGWMKVRASESDLKPRFSATMASIGVRTGILLGGMAANGAMLSEAWEWTLTLDETGPCISFEKAKWLRDDSLGILARMGACLLNSPFGLFFIGGVSTTVLGRIHDIVKIWKIESHVYNANFWDWASVDVSANCKRSLLVGHCAIASQESISILGGGAVCFSFGIFWNQDMINLFINEPRRDLSTDWIAQGSKPMVQQDSRVGAAKNPTTAVLVARDDQMKSAKDFEMIVRQSQPVILTGLDLGPCITSWTIPYLEAKIGGDRNIIVHEATDALLDFRSKNFQYAKKRFKDFIEEIATGSRQYLRSLSWENPAGRPADISVDFPDLASDFRLPPQLDVVRQNMHSSVLRISGPVTMWLHYDVMANVLCQVKGTKRLLLYPPKDISLFSIPPGGSSSSVNCFEPTKQSPLASAHGQEALLRPGDVLYIPPLWLHTASPLDNISISVNVFFRNLEAGYAPGRDVYGNRDVQAYEKARRDLEKMARSFIKLPPDMGRFYLERLADELKDMAKASRS